MVHLSMMLQVLLILIMHQVRVLYKGLILQLVCTLTLVMLVLVFLGTLWLSHMILSWLLLLVSIMERIDYNNYCSIKLHAVFLY